MKKTLLALSLSTCLTNLANAQQAPQFSEDWIEREAQKANVKLSYHAVAASIQDEETREVVETYINGGNHELKREGAVEFVKAVQRGDISAQQLEDMDSYYVKVDDSGALGLSSSLIADGIAELKDRGEISGNEVVTIDGQQYTANQILQQAYSGNRNTSYQDVMDANNDLYKRLNAEDITINASEFIDKKFEEKNGEIIVTDEQGNSFGHWKMHEPGKLTITDGERADSIAGHIEIDLETGEAYALWEDENGEIHKEYAAVDLYDDIGDPNNWGPNNRIIEDDTQNEADQERDRRIREIETALEKAGVDVEGAAVEIDRELTSAGIAADEALAYVEQEVTKAGGDVDKATAAIEAEFERQRRANQDSQREIAEIKKDLDDAAKHIEEAGGDVEKGLDEWYRQASKEAQQRLDDAAKYVDGKINSGEIAASDWAMQMESKFKQEIGRLDQKIDRVEGRVSNGVAMTGAISQMQFNGRGLGIGAGVANFNGSNAVAVGFGQAYGDTKQWMVRGSVGYAQSDKGGETQRDTMVAAGVTYSFE